MTRSILGSILALALAAAPASAQTAGAKPSTQKPAAPAKPGATTAKPAAPAAAAPAISAKQYGPGVYAIFTTNQGNFIGRLFDKDAPRTVENFVGLAEGKKQWKDPRTGRMVRRAY